MPNSLFSRFWLHESYWVLGHPLNRYDISPEIRGVHKQETFNSGYFHTISLGGFPQAFHRAFDSVDRESTAIVFYSYISVDRRDHSAITMSNVCYAVKLVFSCNWRSIKHQSPTPKTYILAQLSIPCCLRATTMCSLKSFIYPDSFRLPPHPRTKPDRHPQCHGTHLP